ncbi:MAG: lysophospholipid acyltransferase family protein [bacterium]
MLSIRSLLQKILIFIGRLLLRLFFRLEVRGREKFPLEGPVIVVCNHHSYLDPPVLIVSSPRIIHFIAKQELFKIPIISFFVKLFESIPVDRSNPKPSTFKKTFQYLKESKVIGIFPEGTRVKNVSDFGKAQAGVELIISKSNVPILITKIDGTYQWYKKFKIIVTFKELIHNPSITVSEIMQKIYQD